MRKPAPPVTSGYDKGFSSGPTPSRSISGPALSFSIRPAADTFQYDSLLAKEEDTSVDNELNVRRFKLYFTGFAHKPTIKFKIQLDVERFRSGTGQSGNVRLEEAFVDLTSRPWTQLRLGQFKVPFGYEKMTSSGRLNLVDRSIVHTFFGVDQEPGVNLFGQSR